MTRERSIRGSADTDRPRPRTRGLCARRPAPTPRPALGDPRHGPPSRGGGGRRARSEGEGLAPGPRSPPLGDTPPPKRPFSPRGGLGVVPTEVASGEAPRVPPSIPLCGPEWYGPMGRGAGPTAPGWRPVAKAVAQRGRGGGGAWAPSLPCTRPKARGRAGAGHAGSGECAGAPSIAVATSLFAPSSPLEGSGWRKMREAGG